MTDKTFWKRLELFIADVQVNDIPGEEEKEYILSTARKQQAQKPEESEELKATILEILGTTKGLPDSDITRMIEKQNIEAADKIIALFQAQKPAVCAKAVELL